MTAVLLCICKHLWHFVLQPIVLPQNESSIQSGSSQKIISEIQLYKGQQNKIGECFFLVKGWCF